MAQVLELLDGNLITPRGLCDVLDVVEEYTGTEIRQYIEDYLDVPGLKEDIRQNEWLWQSVK